METTTLPVSMLIKKEGYYISYNPFSDGYGCNTTAIVFETFGSTFLVLKGDHFEELKKTDNPIDYYIQYIEQSHKFSDSNQLETKKNSDRLVNAFIEQNIKNLEHFYLGSVEKLKELKNKGKK
jgi:hypothetical protein